MNCNEPVGLYTGHGSPSVGGVLKPINTSGIFPPNTPERPVCNGFSGWKCMFCNVCDGVCGGNH